MKTSALGCDPLEDCCRMLFFACAASAWAASETLAKGCFVKT